MQYAPTKRETSKASASSSLKSLPRQADPDLVLRLDAELAVCGLRAQVDQRIAAPDVDASRNALEVAGTSRVGSNETHVNLL
jgi:hypothetical protein